jgi:lysophospholipase L1-like esterase
MKQKNKMKIGICLAALTLLAGNIGSAGVSPENPMNTFATFDARAQKGEQLNVVFFGGSLTWGAQSTDPQRTSYRALVSQHLKEAYPKARLELWDSAIGGTGTQLGAFRLERDVLAHKPDLVFLEFTINDDPYHTPDPDRLASYESIVRRLVQAGVPVEQVILPSKQDVLANPPARPLDAKHKEIAQAYGLPVADAVALVKARVAEGKATPDQLWDAAPDATHPGDAGYALYAEAAWQTFQQAVAQKAQCRVPAAMLNADTYMTVNRFKLASLKKLPLGWKAGLPKRSAVAYDFTPSRWMETVAVASRAKDEMQTPEPLVLKVQGRNLMFFGEATQQSGKYRVLVDGKEVKASDIGGISQHGNWRYVEMLAQNLDASVPHRVEIIPELAPGQDFSMESLCVAGAPASVEAASYTTPQK